MNFAGSHELPKAYKSPRVGRDRKEISREPFSTSSSRYTSTSYKPSTDDYKEDAFSFRDSDGESKRSTSMSRLYGRKITHASGSSFGSQPQLSDATKRTTISMGANYRTQQSDSRKRKTLEPNRSRKSDQAFTVSQSLQPASSRSKNFSGYSSSESFGTQENDDLYPNSPSKSRKYQNPSSKYGDRFYPDPLQSAGGHRSQSTMSQDTDSTITIGNTQSGFEELADYFNKKLEDVQKQSEKLKGESNSRRMESFQDDASMFSLSKGPPGGGTFVRRGKNHDNSTIRPTNRANTLKSQTSAATHDGRANSKSRTSPQMADPNSLLSVKNEIDELKSQIAKSLTRASKNSVLTAEDMDDMADYFSKRLEECQKQVYEAVSKVQSEVGELKEDYNGSSPERGRSRHRRGNGPADGSYYDGSGVGAKRSTFRPPARPKRDEFMENKSAYADNGFSNAPSSLRNRGQNYPPILPPRSNNPSVDERFSSEELPPDYGDNAFTPFFDDDDFEMESLGSDREDNWDDFEEFVDDDTPAPETSIPVPQITFKTNNYVYQAIFILYICAFLAYVFVRIHFTLDAPGLNRIYCIVVAILEIITAPSLILQGCCLWRWVSRDPPPEDAFLSPKFHTARIMVPTYKEPLEVIAGTVHEIVHMDLPSHFHVHVYVLDDGKRENIEKWVLSKRTKRRVFLHYVARPKLPGVPHHAKAGNINHTLHYVFDDAFAEKECVIIFDADFMPRRNYLLKVLPVFSEKRTRPIGLVQTPQFFYNVNPDEDVWDHLNVSFFHRIEPSLDRWSAVNCCGTNFTVRADALKDIGYFPVGCLTEDTLLSLRLCTMGWGVAYHHEVLAIGQSPHEITEIFKQRSRWCKGNLQIFLEEFPLMQSGLSFTQRVFYSSCGFNYFCASLSIPFFQLVPAWAIFFGLWPVSQIGLEFAFAFFIYYILGNILLLFPPPGFSIRDMWNGELASTNLWFTYFNGVRRIVGSKLLKGKGELTFKTTKKKTEEDDEGSNVGFQKEDVRACYMHFIMFFIMVVTIAFAIIKAVIATDVKFYFYYMYMIGMSWALINMTPYLIVVIYCYYRVRIPGLVVACFRNIQLILRVVCAALIMVQAFTTRNLTENFVCPHDYTGELGVSPLAVVQTLDISSGLQVSRNAFWLLGLNDDFYTIQQIKQTACNEDEIPVIVFFMHPAQGLALDAEAGHYMPDERIDTWDEYDKFIDKYAAELKDVPSLIVMEPALLMHTYNSKTDYHNTDYQIQFTQRVHSVVEKFSRSWVYVDAGNAMYLQWQVNLDHVISVMKQMPQSIRGFSINVGSFVNTSFNEQLASEIHCQTGMHFIIDTSRNGGEFSSRPLDEINECTYDPPGVRNGTKPTFLEGATVKTLVAERQSAEATAEYDDQAAETIPANRKRRWLDGLQQLKKKERNIMKRWTISRNPGKANAAESNNYGEYTAEESDYYDGEDSPACVTTEATGLDAFTWVKTPGESDGRLFESGTYHPCLLNHLQECSDTCPQYVPKIFGEFQRPDQCICAGTNK